VDLELSGEQRMLVEAIDDVLAQSAPGRLWSELVDFGALDTDSLGGVELALIARSIGRVLAAVPFVDSAAAHYALTLDEGASAGICAAESSVVSFGRTVDLLVPRADDAAVVARGAPGVELEDATSLDPSLQPVVARLDAAELEPVKGSPAVLAAVGGVLATAEAVGAAGAVLALARDYAAERRQFGHTIGSFQAIRHLLADMHVKVESSWSSVLYAAAALDEAHDDAHRTAAVAKAYGARATRDVAHGALQVFGGVAFTDEHPAHRYLRRIVVRGEQFGTAAEHERELGGTLADVEVRS
jgi:hypothetical protein